MAHVHVAQQESSSAASTNLAVRRVNGQKGLERTSLERFLDLRRHHHDPLKRTFLAAVFGHTALTFTDFHLDLIIVIKLEFLGWRDSVNRGRL